MSRPAAARPARWWPAFVVLAALATLPELAREPQSGLDPSWQLGLHLARERGLTVGRDVFFTYGPWGFLTVPLTLVRSFWLASLAYHAAVQFALFGVLAAWTRRRLDAPRAVVAVLTLLLFAPIAEYRWLLALVLAASLVVRARGRRAWAAAACCGALGAAMLMIKFSMGLAALLVVLGAAAAAWGLRNVAVGAALVAGYLVGALASGSAALGSPAAWLRFCGVSWQVSTGYASALVRSGPPWQPLLVVSAGLCLAAGVAAVGRPVRARALALALPAAGLFLVTFKHAFVRHETHGFLAFGVGAPLAVWIALELAGQGSRPSRTLRTAGACLLVAGALVLRPPTRLPGLPGAVVANLAAAVRAESDTRGAAHRSALGERLRRDLPLHPQIVERVAGRSCDVLTVELALVEAWGLDWRPRRLLQSYAVATAGLDALDAESLSGAQAPERLLVSLQGLDTRHPLMDAPLTWRAILAHYEPLGRDSRWLVLARRSAPRIAVERPLGSFALPFHRVLPIPRPERGHLEMYLEIEPSLAGRLAGAAWKLPEIRLVLASDSGETSAPRRLVPATAAAPFPLLDAWPDSPRDLERLFGMPDPAPPAGLGLISRGTWAWGEARASFVAVEWSEADSPERAAAGTMPP